MITITSTATAVPPNVLSRELVKEYYGRTFSLSDRRLQAMFEILDNSRIDKRYSLFPVDYLIQPRSLTQKNSEYREHAIALSRQVAEQALARANRDPSEVDMIVSVSCTGFMIPSVEAYLIGDMGFRPDVRRLPITELGCAAGAVGLTRAWEYLRAHPNATVLLIAVELPTLTFQRDDLSQANLISAALFGDGVAAAVISDGAGKGPAILDSQSYLFPSSIDAMGFDLKDTGFHIVLSKEVPAAHPRKYRRLAGRIPLPEWTHPKADQGLRAASRRPEIARLYAGRAGAVRLPGAAFLGCFARIWQSFQRFGAVRAARVDDARGSQSR